MQLVSQAWTPSPVQLRGSPPPARVRPDRRARARQGAAVAVAYERRRGPSARGRGTLTQWNGRGGCLSAVHPLSIGDWLLLRALAPSGPRPAVSRPRLARVVSESPGAEPGRYAYGVSFADGPGQRLTYALYALIPVAAGLLFLAGAVHVLVLKAGNVDYFWYRPLANVYSLLISFYILSRFALSALYRPPRARGFRPTVSAIVACKNEEAAIGRTIDCIYASDYPRDRLQVIAVNDGSTDGTLDEMRRAQERHPDLMLVDFGCNRGKRHGMAAGARAARGDILLYVDSDSFLRPDTLANIVQGFADPSVGAVCGHAHVQNARKNFLTRMQEVRYYVAFRVVKAAESLFGAVACCSGCLAAYRRAYVMPILDVWLGQTFLGTPATFGDDRSLTNFMLRRHRVIYDARAQCSTLVPETFRQFFKQQLRWKKSWVRETFLASHFMWKRHPLAAFFFYLGAIFPVVSPVVAFNAIVYPLLAHGQVSLLYVYGATLMSALYGLYYLARLRSGLWVYGVAFSFFYMFVLVWQTYYALLTVRRNHWGTR